ncbi:substrate-binding domain-containing protein [Natribacillus halophilus]|uniref:Monosaccharide ABC transporter substrate-binding protein, CUT2 family n=1 Tax=Natribacillus halophilus TaxID=549003 RepID=A0A1G8LMG9_9BACI|nr:substrate-binding domain-containing protein [Natribacillus halophilus]SDI56657.1 monosaccharide ABC transporter substrate-binding protein, CUT2 family [Natribacillus halophilus]
MKRVWFFGLALGTAISLSACGDGEATGDSENGDDEDTDLTIGISLPSATHGWMGALIDQAETEANDISENEGIDYVMTNAEDPNEQANDVDDLISQDVDALVLLPIESAALTPAGQNVADADIPLVIVDRELENDAAEVVVTGDNEGIGYNAGQYLIDELDGEGDIVEITGPPNSVTEQRGAGFEEAIEGEDGIEVVASQDGDFSTETSLDVMQNVLQAQDNIDAVYTQDDGMAFGVLQAIEEADREDIQYITGAGGEEEMYDHIQDEDSLITATFLYSPSMSVEGVRLGADLAQGEEPEEEEVVMEATEVTDENVDEHYEDAPF